MMFPFLVVAHLTIYESTSSINNGFVPFQVNKVFSKEIFWGEGAGGGTSG